MGIASSAISVAIVTGLFRAGAINGRQLEAIFADAHAAAVNVGDFAQAAAEEIEQFIASVRHELELP